MCTLMLFVLNNFTLSILSSHELFICLVQGTLNKAHTLPNRFSWGSQCSWTLTPAWNSFVQGNERL